MYNYNSIFNIMYITIYHITNDNMTNIIYNYKSVYYSVIRVYAISP